MRLFSIPLLMVALVGCVSFGKKNTKSGWAVLDKAESLDCAPWPLREKDLQVDELALVHERGHGFLATGTRRDASRMAYFAPFAGDPEVDAERFISLSLPKNGELLGGFVGGGRTYAVVAVNGGGRSSLEVRTVLDNIVRYKADLYSGSVEEGATVGADGGAWITFKDDDGRFRLARLELGQGGKLSHRLVPVTLPARPVALADQGGLWLYWKDGEQARPFRAQRVPLSGAPAPARELDLALVSQVESWSAGAHRGRHYLALIDGDTLIGQARLRVAEVQWGEGLPRVNWIKEAELRDVHATDPVLLSSGSRLEVMLMKWVDEESTIARYMIGAENLGKPSFSGIFPKGTRILEAFPGRTSRDQWVLARNRDETRWAFHLCELQ